MRIGSLTVKYVLRGRPGRRDVGRGQQGTLVSSPVGRERPGEGGTGRYFQSLVFRPVPEAAVLEPSLLVRASRLMPGDHSRVRPAANVRAGYAQYTNVAKASRRA